MKQEMNIKAFFFDIGGVLVKVNPSSAIQKISESLDVSAEHIQKALSNELLATYEKGHLSSNQFYEQLLINYGSSNNLSLETFKSYWEDMLFPYEETVKFIRRVTEDFPVWLLSNTNEFHYDLLQKHFPFMKWVKGGTYSFKVGSMKPEPLIYEEAIKKSGFQPGEILFIDDLEVNVAAAKDQGLNAICFKDFEMFGAELRARYPQLGYLL